MDAQACLNSRDTVHVRTFFMSPRSFSFHQNTCNIAVNMVNLISIC